jgi:hypothetical protein
MAAMKIPRSQNMNMKKTQKIESKTEVNGPEYFGCEVNENGKGLTTNMQELNIENLKYTHTLISNQH